MTTAKKLIIIVGIVGVAGTIGYFVYTGIKKKSEEGEAETESEEKPEAGKPETKLPPEIIGKTPIQNATLRPGATLTPSGKQPIQNATLRPAGATVLPSGKLPIQNATLRPGATLTPSGKQPIQNATLFTFPIKTAFGRFDGLQFSAEGSSWND